MKRIALLGLVSALVLAFCACSGSDAPLSGATTDESTYPQALIAPDAFSSFEEFEKHEKEAGEASVSKYYVPAAVPEGYAFAGITKRDGVYVAVHYLLPADKLPSTEKLDSHGIERMTSLICEYSLFADGTVSLNQFIQNGFKPLELDGKTYYHSTEYSTDAQTIGYEIVFLDEGQLIYLHLPAVDSFENMLKFVQVKPIYLE